jgi:YD repeat-containing protein
MWRLLQDAGLVALDRPLPPPREHNKRQTRATSKRARQVGAVAAVMLALLLAPADATAQQRTTYGSDGRAIERSTTDTQGTITTRDASGRVIARETPTGGGSVIYGPDGRRIGSTTEQRRERER